MISISDQEFDGFIASCSNLKFNKYDILSSPDEVPQHVFFVSKGLIRVFITDEEGVEHTVHFAMENQFIVDYSHFILKTPAVYTLQAIEATEVVSIPRSAIEWGYDHLAEGNKLGRLIAEYYFIYQDHRIHSRYTRTPKERYDSLESIFPNIHQRVPQHQIASYLGITPIHLSRLKRSNS